MLMNAEGLPALADALLAAGVSTDVTSGVIGGNAARFLRASLSQ